MKENLNSADAHYMYLAMVVKLDPEYVVRWYREMDCSRFHDQRLQAVYNEAMQKSDFRNVNQKGFEMDRRRHSGGVNINREQTSSGFSNYNDTNRQNSFEFDNNAGRQPPPPTNSELGTKERPLQVIMEDTKYRDGKVLGRMVFRNALFLYILYLIYNNMNGLNPGSMIGGSKQYIPEKSSQDVRFEDVQGCDEAKAELQEVVEFLRDPEKFERLGAKIPCGVLLVGPPGTGKTLLARAIAGEAEVPFFFVSGSEFDEMFVGVGASRIRKLFESAKENAPSIVFIDELDAVGGKRNVEESSRYSRMTLNQLLIELDGFKEDQGVIVVGATNFPEVLDKALVRPGRFDTRVHVTLPDVRGRSNILNLYIQKSHCADDVDVDIIARSTSGFSGAELANLVNQAALRAASLQLPQITMEHFDWARDKIIMGPERRSAVIEAADQKVTAYHEGGHAIVAMYTDDAEPPLKATIIPRGDALGYVMTLPSKDQLSVTRKQLLAKMDVAMGGRVAEELVFGEDSITTGASSDMQHATRIARAMVTQYGMSEKVGTVLIDEQRNKISPELNKVIEEEVRRLIRESYARAKELLQKRHKEHKRLAEGLLKHETLTNDQINLIVKGKTIS